MIYLEPRSVYDAAIVKQSPIVYDYETLIDCIIEHHECTYEEAVDWFSYNIECLSGFMYIGECNADT